MKLIKPSKRYRDQVMSYRREFLDSRDNLAGTSYLSNYDSYSEWLQFVQDNEHPETKQTEVTATVFLFIRESDDKLIGLCNLRHDLNDYLFHYGGHIGYSVKRDERRKGYATQILQLLLNECKKIGLMSILLTCDKLNIASAKIIRNSGAILENEVELEGEIIQRYWLNL